MSDRLNDLRRERAVIQAHLEWLDREIASQSGGAANTSAPAPTAAAHAAPLAANASLGTIPLPLAAATPGPPEIDIALDSYRQNPVALQSDVRKGCFLYFAIAFLLLFLVVGAFYLYSRSLHADRAAPATTPALEDPARR